MSFFVKAPEDEVGVGFKSRGGRAACVVKGYIDSTK